MEEIGLRRIRALIFGLPPEAMVWRREYGWGIAEELAAVGLELQHAILRVLIQANSKKGSSPPKQLHVPRPYEARERARRRGRPASAERIASFGGEIRRREAAK